jgi:hypothetical protein
MPTDYFSQDDMPHSEIFAGLDDGRFELWRCDGEGRQWFKTREWPEIHGDHAEAIAETDDLLHPEIGVVSGIATVYGNVAPSSEVELISIAAGELATVQSDPLGMFALEIRLPAGEHRIWGRVHQPNGELGQWDMRTIRVEPDFDGEDYIESWPDDGMILAGDNDDD